MELFTWQALGGVAGATILTVLIVNAMRLALDWSPRWLALAVALVIQIILWTVISDRSWPAFWLAVFNSFVVYAAATGGNAIVGTVLSPEPETRAAQSAGARPFWSPWW